MNLSDFLLIILGLAIFESISSIDNAVINADVLSTMPKKWRRWFLVYGIFFAVFVVRGLLPLALVYFTTPGINLGDAFVATFHSHGQAKDAIEKQRPILLAGGGIFLIFLFLHWLFLEVKKYAFFLEKHIHKNYSIWFYALASIVLFSFSWVTIKINPFIALGAVGGSTAFFILNGFKRNAEEKEQELKSEHITNLSKVLYLEMIDATFSIDGVLGAFAFTVAVPLILIGNGLGALIVRYLTVHGVKTVKKYAYLKNGAMYSIGVLGIVMMLESLGHNIHSWVSPAITFFIVAVFFYLSKKELEVEKVIQ